jgi:hypothetical protein
MSYLACQYEFSTLFLLTSLSFWPLGRMTLSGKRTLFQSAVVPVL